MPPFSSPRGSEGRMSPRWVGDGILFLLCRDVKCHIIYNIMEILQFFKLSLIAFSATLYNSYVSKALVAVE